MARARGGGGAGLAWALVVFAGLFIITLILAIVFYTQIEQHKLAAEEAQNEKRRYVRAAEEAFDDIQALAANQAEGSVVAQLRTQRDQLKSIITGDTRRSLQAIQRDKQEFEEMVRTQVQDEDSPISSFIDVSALANEPYSSQVSRFLQSLEAASNSNVQLTATVAQEQERAEREVARVQELAAQHAQTLSMLSEQLQTRGTQFDGMVQRLRSDFEELSRELTDLREGKDGRIRELEQSVEDWRRRYESLYRDWVRSRRIDPTDPYVQPDGQVVSVTEDNIVYINLGRNDRIMPGMTFEVFSPGTVISVEEDDEPRGKASIEIFEVSDIAAKARITRRARGAAVQPDDNIVNVVYDRYKTLKFFVYGDFDLDGDGETTLAERMRVQSMVREYGGVLVDDLSLNVDFVVMGRQPPLPEPLSREAELDQRLIEQNIRAQQEYQRYQDLVQEARAFAIPILNQNRFLQMVGFYGQRR